MIQLLTKQAKLKPQLMKLNGLFEIDFANLAMFL